MDTSNRNVSAAPAPSIPSAGSSKLPETDEGSSEDGNENGENSKRRRHSLAGEDGPHRVQLACFHCRTKRIRCNGVKPICESCAKANETCQWPSGRRRKRTRKEMEAARELEAALQGQIQAEQNTSLITNLGADPNPLVPVDQSFASNDMFRTQFDISNFCSTGTNGAMFAWPSGFTPDDQVSAIPFGPADPQSQNYPLSGMPDTRLISALQKQTAYIEGAPGDDDLELFYYRLMGPTALHPAVNRISLKLQRRAGDTPYSGAPQSKQTPTTQPDPNPNDIFDESGMPHPHVYTPLFDTFFKHMSQYFPSISRQRMNERFESGTMSQFYCNCVCALAARYTDPAKSNPTAACAPFIAKAQELVIPLLHLPTHDVVTGLLLLAWASYGQGSDSGLWQFSGMCFRMGLDLGFHEENEMYESPAHLVRTRLLFWTMFITDRIVAFGTGRPASIAEDVIEIPLPEDQDFFPDPARNTATDAIELVEPVPFVQLTKLMVICGRISNVLNGRRGRARTLATTNEPLAEQLAELQGRLAQFVSGLPPTLQWSVDNFKHQQARGHGGVFLALHLWAHAVLALVYHPELLKNPSGIETPLSQSMSRSIKLALASSRQISECMIFADLLAETAYTTNPFIVQTLYVSGMALLLEMRTGQASMTDGSVEKATDGANTNGINIYLVTMSRQNLSALLKALQRIEHYWSGASSVATILEKRSGIPRSTPRLPGSTFISLPDRGLLKRFLTDREHPYNVAPPTETSLREAAAKTGTGSGPSPQWLSDLMSAYTVENMSFGPADSSDLERLLGVSLDGGAGTGGVDVGTDAMSGMIFPHS